jgi:hypothetical protein
VGRSGCEARSFLVLCLYVSNAALKMDTKLEREVDVAGTADMMVRGEGGDRQVAAQQALVMPETTRQRSKVCGRSESFGNVNLKSAYSVSPSYYLRF